MARQPITLQFETFEMSGELETAETDSGPHFSLYLGEDDLLRVMEPAEIDEVKAQGAYIKLPIGPEGSEVPVELKVEQDGV